MRPGGFCFNKRSKCESQNQRGTVVDSSRSSVNLTAQTVHTVPGTTIKKGSHTQY